MKFASPKRSAVVRRKAWPQTKWKPSASRRPSGSVMRSAVSSNGVRIASSETVENPYDTASTTNGSARATSKRAPPSGGPASPTTAFRPVSAPAAAGSCFAGTTARSAPT